MKFILVPFQINKNSRLFILVNLLAAIILILIIPSTVCAWTFWEHNHLGLNSYWNACYEIFLILDKGIIEADEGMISRFSIACGNINAYKNSEKAKPFPSGQNRLLNDILYSISNTYGQACAISGDHADNPEDLLYEQRDIESIKHYLVLASENSPHFHPQVTRMWQKYHSEAVSFAMSGYKAENIISAREHFDKAFYYNAFADHFLQDSFSSGHMCFNRQASSAGSAKVFHDVWNERGRLVSNSKGEYWTTYGDGSIWHCSEQWQNNYDNWRNLPRKSRIKKKISPRYWGMGLSPDPPDKPSIAFCRRVKESERRIQIASNASIYEVIHTFVFGEKRTHSTMIFRDVSLEFPKSALINPYFREILLPNTFIFRKWNRKTYDDNYNVENYEVVNLDQIFVAPKRLLIFDSEMPIIMHFKPPLYSISALLGYSLNLEGQVKQPLEIGMLAGLKYNSSSFSHMNIPFEIAVNTKISISIGSSPNGILTHEVLIGYLVGHKYVKNRLLPRGYFRLAISDKEDGEIKKAYGEEYDKNKLETYRDTFYVDSSSTVYMAYRAHIEAGDWVLRLSAGPLFSAIDFVSLEIEDRTDSAVNYFFKTETQPGVYFSLGIGKLGAVIHSQPKSK